MATLNPYLSVHTTGYDTAHNLYADMIDENIEISGQEYYYIPRTLSDSMDNIFGEDILSSFNSYVSIPMYVLDFTGWGGEQEMLSKFGMEVRNTASFIISRRMYKDSVVPIVPANRHENLKFRPNEGDLIYVPFSNSLMEVKFVDDENPVFYQLSKKFVWSLRCELVTLNNENFNTGIPDIDAFNINLDRLNTGVNMETGFSIICEDGGNVLNEEYTVSEAYSEQLGFGNNDEIKREFMDIMNFDANNPFSSTF
jgi:Virus neck protein